jgi:hypothetical protein
MQYVMLASWKPGLSRAEMDGAMVRRAGWQFPDDVNPIGEWWPMASSPAVIAVFETDAPGALMELMLSWGDLFDLQVIPAVSADQGLQLGPAAMEARSRKGA